MCGCILAGLLYMHAGAKGWALWCPRAAARSTLIISARFAAGLLCGLFWRLDVRFTLDAGEAKCISNCPYKLKRLVYD